MTMPVVMDDGDRATLFVFTAINRFQRFLKLLLSGVVTGTLSLHGQQQGSNEFHVLSPNERKEVKAIEQAVSKNLQALQKKHTYG